MIYVIALMMLYGILQLRLRQKHLFNLIVSDVYNCKIKHFNVANVWKWLWRIFMTSWVFNELKRLRLERKLFAFYFLLFIYVYQCLFINKKKMSITKDTLAELYCISRPARDYTRLDLWFFFIDLLRDSPGSGQVGGISILYENCIWTTYPCWMSI